MQAGAFAEHAIRSVEYTICDDDSWIGDLHDYGHRAPQVSTASIRAAGPWLQVNLPRSTRIRLTLALDLRANVLSYRSPFEGADA
ncbi:hypothetical protein [Actinospica robiniae]|uniref:hypothetical protein n=1 Tax=Actinospica robiniae TaxID=304901 RepID=UPI0003F59C25|nr:hypothetical protein [Actinospica robiniae]